VVGVARFDLGQGGKALLRFLQCGPELCRMQCGFGDLLVYFRSKLSAAQTR
jgi:hypothetical protein